MENDFFPKSGKLKLMAVAVFKKYTNYVQSERMYFLKSLCRHISLHILGYF